MLWFFIVSYYYNHYGHVVMCSGNGKLASCFAIIGFIVMMSLDVGLG